jgi:hypothetical protein
VWAEILGISEAAIRSRTPLERAPEIISVLIAVGGLQEIRIGPIASGRSPSRVLAQ